MTSRRELLNICTERLKKRRTEYEKLAAELYFLENGGDILSFPLWWSEVQGRNKWCYDLDAIDAYVNFPYGGYKPRSVVVVSVEDEEWTTVEFIEGKECTGDLEEDKYGITQEDTEMEIKGNLNCVSSKGTKDACYQPLPEPNMQSSCDNAVVEECTNDKLREDSVTERESLNCVSSKVTGDKSSQLVSQRKKRTKGRQCCVNGCESVDETRSLYTFPSIVVRGVVCSKSVSRCKQWVQQCGNKNLLQEPTASLHKKYFVCSIHFHDSQFYNLSRKSLLPNAVPSLNFSHAFSADEMYMFPVFGHAKDIYAGTEDNVVANDQVNLTDEGNDADQYIFTLTESSIKDKFYKDYMKDMESLKWYNCPDCKEVFMCKRKLRRPCLHTNNCQKFSAMNDMDPGDVPNELKGLSFLEEQLIARVHPLISVYKIKGHQYGYKGNVINFAQDVNQFAKELPHKISDLESVVAVRTQDCESPKEFFVNASKVRTALHWLKANNPYYNDVEISEENLSLLPDEGNVFNDVPTILLKDSPNGCAEPLNLDEKNADEEFLDESANETICENGQNKEVNPSVISLSETPVENDNFDYLEESGVPTTINNNQNDQVEQVLNWPSISKAPLSEFKTVGYVCQAFPTLFPTGKADLNSQMRNKPVTPTQYFQHLFRYEDRRFQEHPRFRYFAMNSLMRWSVIENGSVFVERKDEFDNMSIEQLKEKIKEDPKYVEKLMYQCSNVRGTKEYWKARRTELLQMIEQLGMPTLFFTLSAADMHWPGLFKLLAPDEDITTMTEKRRRDLISAYPVIADKYFAERVNSFVTKVLKPKYKVNDLWYRFEYQHRGSPHVHGVLWLEGAPDVTDITTKSDEDIQKVIDYFNELICAQHPQLDTPPAAVHPCRINLEEVIDLKRDLAELLNKVQRHTVCTEGYCVKNKKKCRFNFPKEVKENSEIIINNDDIEFVPSRNDPRLNKFNPYMILLWRANMDIAPVLSKRALVNYLAKYVSKSEDRSTSLEQIMKSVCEDKGAKTVKSFLHKLFIRACSSRDYSAQEVGHYVLGERFVCSGGRDFVYLYLHKKDNWIRVETNKKNGKFGSSLVEKYMNRGSEYKDRSLWNMAKSFNFSTSKPRKKDAIVIVYPKVSFNAAKSSNEEYFKQQVILHVPWDSQNQLPNDKYSWEEIYKMNTNVINQCTQTSLNGIEADVEAQEIYESDNCHEYILSREEWMAVAAMGPSQHTPEIDLGRRNIDTSFDWNATSQKYAQYGTISELQTFISREKAKHQPSRSIVPFPSVPLNNEQLQVVSLVKKQIQHITNPSEYGNTLPKTVVVQGSAGTGKSVAIQAITNVIQSELGSDAILLLAPTGVAALNISGSTIHSKLHICTSREFTDLKTETARKFCNDFKNIKFIVIDEYSMVGCAMLGMIDRRLRQATGKVDEDFGGLNLYLFGDLNQLPCILDKPLYAEEFPESEIAIHGYLLWKSMSASILLHEIHRQSDMTFVNLLKNVSLGKVTEADYELLKTRFISNVSNEVQKQFESTLRLFPTKDKVHDLNLASLRKAQHNTSGQPVPLALINSKNNNSEAEKADSDQAGGLSKTLQLGQSCKIMLRSNLWTEKGLVNGAIGTVVDIIYDTDCSPPDDMPALLVCRFEDYKGPFLGDDSVQRLVPIPVVTKSWTSANGTSCSRTMFPVHPAYAVTIHKSQGLTLGKEVMDIGGKKEMSPGISFVGLSRVKSLDGLLLYPFSLQRFLSINKSRALQSKAKALEQLQAIKVSSLRVCCYCLRVVC